MHHMVKWAHFSHFEQMNNTLGWVSNEIVLLDYSSFLGLALTAH